jgi:DNA-3-methyladenine glycosylase II
MDSHHAAIDRLIVDDPALAAVIDRFGRPAVFRRPATFATLVLLILEQQVSLASAAAAFGRLEGAGPVTPELVLSLDNDQLRAIGFSRQKAGYARGLATAILSERLDLARLETLSDDTARTTLVALPGIGPWTADVFLLSCLGRQDIWPVGDRALQVGTRDLLGLDETPSPPHLDTIGDRWRPLRSTAAQIIWHDYLARRNRAP